MATEGGTLLTTRLKVLVDWAPSLSVALIVTVWLCPGPFVGRNDQDQVPLLVPVWVTEPTEAEMVTTSAPTSANVPVLDACEPSLTVTVALPVMATDGGTLLTTRPK